MSLLAPVSIPPHVFVRPSVMLVLMIVGNDFMVDPVTVFIPNLIQIHPPVLELNIRTYSRMASPVYMRSFYGHHAYNTYEGNCVRRLQ